MLKNIVLASIVFVSGLMAANEVNVYSHRHYDTDKKLFKMFEKQTGIKVNVVKDKASKLIKRIESEGKNTPADVLITADVGRLVLATDKGILQRVTSPLLDESVPSNLRSDEGYWYDITKRARVIMYHKDRVKPSDLSTYADLTSKKWHKKILIRKSNNIYNQSLLASFIASDGEVAATKWAKGIVNNMARKPAGNDRDQMKAVAAGMGDIAVVNTYYVGKLLNSKKSAEVRVGKKMGVFFPNQGVGERGAHINISGAGVIKWSKNRRNAITFLEFLASPQAQELFAKANYEYPVNPKVEPSDLLKSWGTFKEDTTPLEAFGRNNANAVKVFNKVGWK
jgi:iron(III) transport system substrate-binding protein